MLARTSPSAVSSPPSSSRGHIGQKTQFRVFRLGPPRLQLYECSRSRLWSPFFAAAHQGFRCVARIGTGICFVDILLGYSNARARVSGRPSSPPSSSRGHIGRKTHFCVFRLGPLRLQPCERSRSLLRPPFFAAVAVSGAKIHISSYFDLQYQGFGCLCERSRLLLRPPSLTAVVYQVFGYANARARVSGHRSSPPWSSRGPKYAFFRILTCSTRFQLYERSRLCLRPPFLAAVIVSQAKICILSYFDLQHQGFSCMNDRARVSGGRSSPPPPS
ncbi:hypothetical protein B0H10DRAFT_2218110 [Mycena sp. CBHHK59/15]|nr:hypothetical protein B0H10DRAFT_2218110 [Mycena sp. CBHHK59/15]